MSKLTRSFSAMLAGTAFVTVPQALKAQETVKVSSQQSQELKTSGAEASDDDAPITVTGSRIRGATAAGDIVTLDQQAIIAAGQVDLGEAIRSLPQNFSGGQNPGVGFGAGQPNENLNSTSSANLRGLGPNATLTLLNGHRLPYDGASAGVDISSIPLAALDRIEVVPDGASAVYGSDAVAGVINVILKRDFEGVATSAQLGSSTDGGYFRQQADIVGGTTWDGGGFLLAYDFARNSAISKRQRSYVGTADPSASLYPELSRHAVTFAGHHNLGNGITAKLDALYSKRKSRTVGGTIASRFFFEPEVESYTIAPSLDISLGAGWEATALGVFGTDRTNTETTSVPLIGAPRVTTGCFCNSVTSGEFGVEGPLFALGGGDARLALGFGFRNNRLDFTRQINGVASPPFDVTRRSRFAYGEINLPFISPEQGIRGIDRLSVSGALRYEDYPGLDRLATPRLGLVYAPISALSLRASWSRSFKAPTLYQQFLPYQAFLLPAVAFGAGASPRTVLVTGGGNPDIQSERAKSWTAGFDLRPASIPGLTLSATYYDIRYKDRVVEPIIGSVAAAFNNPGYATLINFMPAASLLADLVSGAQFGLQNVSGIAYNPANVVAFIDNRNINVAFQKIRGIDARISWTGELGSGDSLGVDVSGSWLSSSQQITADLPEIRLAGSVFRPPSYRARASANYQSNSFKLSSALNYTGELADRRFAVASKLPPSVTVDFGASYDVIKGEGKDPGLSISLTVNNLFNNKPPIIRTTGPSDTPYDSTNYSPIGRFVAIGIRRHW